MHLNKLVFPFIFLQQHAVGAGGLRGLRLLECEVWLQTRCIWCGPDEERILDIVPGGMELGT